MYIFCWYLMSCTSWAYRILVFPDGIKAVNLGGLRANIKGGGATAAHSEKKVDTHIRCEWSDVIVGVNKYRKLMRILNK